MSLLPLKLRSLLLEQTDFKVIKKFAFKPTSRTTGNQMGDIQEQITAFVEEYFGVKIEADEAYSLALEIWGAMDMKGQLH